MRRHMDYFHLLHHLSQMLHFKDMKNNLTQIYVNLTMQTFALSLVNVFVPIYLYTLGYAIKEIIIFVLVLHLTLGLFSPFAAIVAKHLGFKHTIFLRIPLLVIYLIGLNTLEIYSVPIYLLAFLYGISEALYWVPLNSLFAMSSTKKKRASQVSKLIYIPGIASVISPAVGGVLAVTIGFRPLLLIVSAIMILSMVPLFLTSDIRPDIKFSLKKLFQRRNWRYSIGFIMQGKWYMAAALIWPLFVFFLLSDITSVGYITTAAYVGVIIFTWLLGKFSDRTNKYTLLKLGALFYGLSFFFRYFASSYAHVLLIAFYAGITAVLLEVPFQALVYDRASSQNSTEFVVFRELAFCIGRVTFLLVALVAINKFIVGFTLAGLAAWVLFVLF